MLQGLRYTPSKIVLVQEGLEIPIQLIVKMEYSLLNKDPVFKYKSLIEHCYKWPVDGKVESITDSLLKDLELQCRCK